MISARIAWRRFFVAAAGVAVLTLAAVLVINPYLFVANSDDYGIQCNPPKSLVALPFALEREVDSSAQSFEAYSESTLSVRSTGGERLKIRGVSGFPRPFLGTSPESSEPGGLMYGRDGFDPGPPLDDGRRGAPTTIQLPREPAWSLILYSYGGGASIDLEDLVVGRFDIGSCGDVKLTLPAVAYEGPDAYGSWQMTDTAEFNVNMSRGGRATIRVPAGTAVQLMEDDRKPADDAVPFGVRGGMDDMDWGWVIGDWDSARAKVRLFVTSDVGEPELVFEQLE